MPRYAALTGWGKYVPERVLTNQELTSLVETSEEWIVSRTGIRKRRIAAPEETTSTMCSVAAQQALERAQLRANDLDLILCATVTPDQLLPATACLVQRQLRANHAGAFDINAACTGFLAALITGSQFIQAGTYERVLVVAGETFSRFMNWKDRNTCVLFGDGAGAVVLEATEEPSGIRSSMLACHGDSDRLVAIEAGGCAKPASADTILRGEHFLTMHGPEVFKLAVRSMAAAARQALAEAGLSIAEIRAVIAHQANLRIFQAVQESLELPPEKLFVKLDRYGNTAAASIPIALTEYLMTAELVAGDHLLLLAFGGGFTWGPAVLRWADVSAIVRRRDGARVHRSNIDAPHCTLRDR